MMDRPVHKYHLNADAADSTITDLMAITIYHVIKKARIKKGNSKKQQSKKAGSPSYEADSSSPEGIEAQETNFQEFSLLIRKKTSRLSQRRALQVSVHILLSTSCWQSN
ncbi:uncharacterized protein LOC116202662 [Punica granatum]|uniref:Uncharacterized protein LOC116202662 n=1 Tax=Punica granatum TaxID=22663 RepID=A0A6P8CZB4_PUNGR|nr:uncharacterized protein LOC116202662 [Punica granatum]